jgi:adenylate cyclase
VKTGELLVPETMPYVGDRARASIRNQYLAGADHKALAISPGPIGFSFGQTDDEAAKTAALDTCQKRADAVQPPRKCEIFAVGNEIVSARAHPPLPPQPWTAHDAAVERPFVAKDVPFVRESVHALYDRNYAPGKRYKALAISTTGSSSFYTGQDSDDEAVRRALENCGMAAGLACMTVAIDDVFVLPVPATMKAVAMFRAENNYVVAATSRREVAQQLAGAPNSWNAVAVGSAGRPGLAIKAANEVEATTKALAECAKLDANCRVIAIGPFAVVPGEPN